MQRVTNRESTCRFQEPGFTRITVKPTVVVPAKDKANVSPPCMSATARTIAKATYAPEFDRQTASVLTRSVVRREVAHARHDGALNLMHGEAADFPAAYAVMKGD